MNLGENLETQVDRPQSSIESALTDNRDLISNLRNALEGVECRLAPILRPEIPPQDNAKKLVKPSRSSAPSPLLGELFCQNSDLSEILGNLQSLLGRLDV